MSALFAATYPDRVSSLVLWEAGVGAPASEEVRSALLPWVQNSWGSGESCQCSCELGMNETSSVSPSSSGTRCLRGWRGSHGHEFRNDIRGVLPVISAPTLVIHRSDDPILDRARAVALTELIPGARRVELPGDWHISLIADAEADAPTSSRSSSLGPHRHQRSTPIVCSQRCCSPTSSTPRPRRTARRPALARTARRARSCGRGRDRTVPRDHGEIHR